MVAMNVREELMPVQEGAPGIVSAPVEMQEAGASGVSGWDVGVVMLREGLAKSGRYFTRAALEDVVRAAGGLKCFADHATPDEDRQRPARSVRDVVGVFHRPRLGRWTAPDGTERAQVEATLRVMEHAGWVRELVAQGQALGQPDLVGLSIDALCVVRPAPVETLPAGGGGGQGEGGVAPGRPIAGVRQVVEAVPVLKSCDVVTRASAGGRFLEPARPVREDVVDERRRTKDEGWVVGVREGAGKEGTGRQEQLAQQAEQVHGAGQEQEAPKKQPEKGRRMMEELVVVREDGRGEADRLTAGPVAVAPVATGPAAATVTAGATGPAAGPVVVPGLEARGVQEAQLRYECAQALDERLEVAQLPAQVKERLRRTWHPFHGAMRDRLQWESVEAFTQVLEGEIEAETEVLAAMRDALLRGERAGAPGDWTAGAGGTVGVAGHAGGLVRGYGAVRVEAGVDGASRGRAAVQVALDRLFGVRESADDPDVALLRRNGIAAPRWTSLREAYTQITGDWAVLGVVRPELSLVREANEVTTSVLNQALLNSMTKRLVQDYAGQPQEWRKFCVVTHLRDYKSQDRVKLNDFASLSTVAEGAAYTNLAWDDSRETYTPFKKGNLVVVTRETILNDDLNTIRKIPAKLAVAAGITINEFVYSRFTTNPTMSDGTSVFDDDVQAGVHNNRGTGALSASSLQAAITMMMKQTNSAGKRLNVRPRYLLVPPDLLFTALTIVNSTLVPGSANNDANVLKGAVEPISVAQFTDPNDWYLIADPAQIESLEIGFIGGREAPDLLLQDAPTEGMVFTNDQISYRVRWEFGGGWLDYRGAFWADVSD